MAVYSANAFPDGQIPETNAEQIWGLSYAAKNTDTDNSTLADGDGANGDPASLGVSALLLARGGGDGKNKTGEDFEKAAQRQLASLFKAPRYSNGAISQRTKVAELWSDGMFMIPPFLAYYAVASQNTSLLREAVQQCGLYRDVLIAQTSQDWEGLWMHIIGPEAETKGIWATGNGWAALGMTRVLATVVNWPTSCHWEKEIAHLKGWLFEIFTGLEHAEIDETTGFWKNYLVGSANDPYDNSEEWFGDGSGTAALVAAALRLSVLEPGAAPYLLNITATPRRALSKALGQYNGLLAPTVNPLDWFAQDPVYSGAYNFENIVTQTHPCM